MAHNNGMVPRPGGGLRGSAASPSQGMEVTRGSGFGEMTGAEITGFVPHRPTRPEKSEGGKDN